MNSMIHVLAVTNNGHQTVEPLGIVREVHEAMELARKHAGLPFLPFTMANLFFAETGSFVAFVSMEPPSKPQYVLAMNSRYAEAIVKAIQGEKPTDPH